MTQIGHGPPTTPLDGDIRAVIAPYAAHVEALLEDVARRWTGAAPLPHAMRYAVLGGGKRLRPMMVLAACEAAGATKDTFGGIMSFSDISRNPKGAEILTRRQDFN